MGNLDKDFCDTSNCLHGICCDARAEDCPYFKIAEDFKHHIIKVCQNPKNNNQQDEKQNGAI